VQERVVREICSLRAMWRALETGSLLKNHAPALDPTKRSRMQSDFSMTCSIHKVEDIALRYPGITFEDAFIRKLSDFIQDIHDSLN
jgi:hypothetical protein